MYGMHWKEKRKLHRLRVKSLLWLENKARERIEGNGVTLETSESR